MDGKCRRPLSCRSNLRLRTVPAARRRARPLRGDHPVSVSRLAEHLVEVARAFRGRRAAADYRARQLPRRDRDAAAAGGPPGVWRGPGRIRRPLGVGLQRAPARPRRSVNAGSGCRGFRSRISCDARRRRGASVQPAADRGRQGQSVGAAGVDPVLNSAQCHHAAALVGRLSRSRVRANSARRYASIIGRSTRSAACGFG